MKDQEDRRFHLLFGISLFVSPLPNNFKNPQNGDMTVRIALAVTTQWMEYGKAKFALVYWQTQNSPVLCLD
ncbi:hypothetical protein ABB05_19125 [Lederbergia galactosidilytica]|uniref:Uncharacterized protein n=1 Tax=Lederbergia galactosidilytica TaxID=217031 RepID=A0A177ZHN0_9BACI|nr:hypothetical protein ABB05_19125 [Lederbergia galactosidilytica]